MEEIIPHRKYFATQKEGEEVLMITRRHWIVYISPVLLGVVVILSCIILYSQMGRVSLVSENNALAGIAVALVSTFMLFTVLFVYVSWLVNYLNVQIVTNQNLVDIDQLGLFSRKISELSLEDIQDVSATQHGILQSFLHYGDIVVQTAGEKMNFTFEKVKDPYATAKKIMEIKEKYGAEEVRSVSGPDTVVPESGVDSSSAEQENTGGKTAI
ncbi:MAG: PH domain-containing protein [bacterium]|nr:PH domain-containing protein [bacterium]